MLDLPFYRIARDVKDLPRLRRTPTLFRTNRAMMRADCVTKLSGTRSRAINTLVRFGLATRSLGIVRATRKLARRARLRVARRSKASVHAAPNLDALRHCSWLKALPQIRLCETAVGYEDLARFQGQMNYPRFYYFNQGRIRYSLWHYVGVELCGLDQASVVIDVGAQAGLWGSMIRRRFGCRVFDVDLEYAPGRRGFRIGAAASSIPIESRSASHIVSFCAFNCFEGDDDSAMIREASRLLIPGGRLIIVPLCIADEFVNLYDPHLVPELERLDRGARPAAMVGWGNNFGRWYDQTAFEQRILRHAAEFETEVHRVNHPFSRHEGLDAMYAARLIRRG